MPFPDGREKNREEGEFVLGDQGRPLLETGFEPGFGK